MPNLPGIGSTDALIAALSLLLSAVGLSTAAGLRAYLPVLAVALGSHISTGHGGHLVALTPTFRFLGGLTFIVVLAALGLFEFVIDKIPLLVHLSDLIHTLIRPAAGAVVMAGTTNALSERSVWLAALFGGIVALLVHTTKAVSRPGISGVTAGLGNPLISLVEDVVAGLLTVLAVVAPFFALLLLVLLGIRDRPADVARTALDTQASARHSNQHWRSRSPGQRMIPATLTLPISDCLRTNTRAGREVDFPHVPIDCARGWTHFML